MQNTIYAKTAAIATAIALSVGMLGIATPVLADMNSSSITISVTNQGSIDNTTSARAHTGANVAGGSTGGDGARGGDVLGGGGDNNNGGATSGNGGNGGDGDAGGFIETGDAMADAGTLNTLNTTDVEVDLGGDDMNSSTLDLTVDNDDVDNVITSDTRARARSGDNTAGGSTGGDGARAGDIDGDGGDNNNGGATSGDGGDGGAGGLGGEVVTGDSTSNSGVINVLNAVLLRVRL